MKQILCMKWGRLYGPDYVNRLYRMARRHVTPPMRFVCMTDDPAGLDDGIDPLPCPQLPADLPIPPRRFNSTWRKLTLWQPTLEGLEGEVLFLDLDVVIVDNIDDLFTWGEGFCVMPNASQPGRGIGNTSVYRFTVGSHPHIYQKFVDDPAGVLAAYTNSQTYISRTAGQMSFFPDAWCRLFKVHCVPPWPQRLWQTPQLPDGAKIVAFPGDPNPPDAAAGRWPAPWTKRFYKCIRPTPWIEEHWR